MNVSIIDKVMEQLKVMPQRWQWQVLQFARTLVNVEVRGILGKHYVGCGEGRDRAVVCVGTLHDTAWAEARHKSSY